MSLTWVFILIWSLISGIIGFGFIHFGADLEYLATIHTIDSRVYFGLAMFVFMFLLLSIMKLDMYIKKGDKLCYLKILLKEFYKLC